MRYKIFALVGFLVVLIAAAIPAEAIIVVDTKTGMIGITAAQTLRINVANVGDEVSGIVPCSIVFDSMGNVVARFEGEALTPGSAMSFDYMLPDDMGRTELRVVIELEDRAETNAKRLRNRVETTVEVFDDATGKTEVFYHPPDPQ